MTLALALLAGCALERPGSMPTIEPDVAVNARAADSGGTDHGVVFCDDPPPDAVCEPVHVTTAPPVPNPRACDSRDDCHPDEFCGAGACRTLEGERGTICIERAWLEGRVCPDDYEFIVLNASASHQVFFWEQPLNGSVPCAVETQECWEVDLGEWARWERSYTAALLPPNRIAEHLSNEMSAGAEAVRAQINAGCNTVHPSRPLPGDEAYTRAHYALWFP